MVPDHHGNEELVKDRPQTWGDQEKLVSRKEGKDAASVASTRGKTVRDRQDPQKRQKVSVKPGRNPQPNQ